MSITIQVDTQAGETLNGVLAALGLRAVPAEARVAAPAYAAEAPAVVSAFVDNRVNKQPTRADAEPAKRTRGRKKVDDAQDHAGAIAEAVEPSPAPVFAVRRYDGVLDGEFADSGVAARRLVDLIHNAGEKDALKALLGVNGATFDALPTDRKDDIRDAIEAARAAFAPEPAEAAPQPTPAPAPAGAAQVLDVDGGPLLAVTADKRGAQNVIRAIATGAPPRLGFAAAKAILDRFGVERVSAVPEGDATHGLIAAEGARLLGLPTAGDPA